MKQPSGATITLVLPRDYAAQSCSIARTLEVVGDRWTLLILRNAFFAGATRFGDFQARLNVARDVLADRLSRLTDHGIFERSVYQGRQVRFEYLLTEKGRDLVAVLVAMVEWGDRYHAPDGPPREIVHAHCGGAVEQHLTCGACRAGLEAHEISSRPGPGSGRHAQPPQPVAAS